MKSVSLVHPFTAEAIGLNYNDLIRYHSLPHLKALKLLEKEGLTIRIEYFTASIFPFSKIVGGLKKQFWPVSYPIFKNRHHWRKQESLLQNLSFRVKSPDLTIFNMSGHGSNHIFKLAKIIKAQNKQYIAMIGGINMSKHKEAMDYYRNANHIVVHTNLQKQNLLKILEFSELDIRVIPLGVDREFFKPNHDIKRSNQLLFVGRITPLKQIELAIEALNLAVNTLRDKINLNIIGPISDREYYRSLIDLVNLYKLENNVKFLGSMNQVDIIPYYQEATLLLMPSKHESFGMVMVEAMACETPVIAIAGTGGADEVIADNRTGCLCNKKNYSIKVRDLLMAPTLLSEMRKNCIDEVSKKWSLEKTTKEFRKSIVSTF